MSSHRTSLLRRRLNKALEILLERGPEEFFTSAKDFLQRHGQTRTALMPRQALDYDISPVRFKGRRLNQEALTLALECIENQCFTLVVSQDDYLSVVGGVQIRLVDQQREMNNKGIRYLHLSPYLVRNTLDFSTQSGVMRVNLDGKFLGYVDDETLLAVLGQLITEKTLTSVHIHHLMGWKICYVAQILDLTGDVPINFWLHDFFSICPNYPLLRNDIEYCYAPEPYSNACQLCVYGTIRPLHFQAFNYLFQRYPIQIIAPSEFALDLWREKIPGNFGEGFVIPNARLEWRDKEVRLDKPGQLKVAFVGYPVFHKGWQTWLNLTDQFGKDLRYRFSLFSSEKYPSRNFENIFVEVNQHNRSAMIDALQKNQIDVAFLWSICPETFSYTLYESLAAGCFIITNPASGNIQAYIKAHPDSGVIIDNDRSLTELFNGDGILDYLLEYQREGKRKGVLHKPYS